MCQWQPELPGNLGTKKALLLLTSINIRANLTNIKLLVAFRSFTTIGTVSLYHFFANGSYRKLRHTWIVSEDVGASAEVESCADNTELSQPLGSD